MPGLGSKPGIFLDNFHLLLPHINAELQRGPLSLVSIGDILRQTHQRQQHATVSILLTLAKWGDAI